MPTRSIVKVPRPSGAKVGALSNASSGGAGHRFIAAIAVWLLRLRLKTALLFPTAALVQGMASLGM
eukprot:CAMPEP_0183388850 /NCGR_PEP_ID=MMETSP0370-20130417/4464_1 /TAXON_ID=268820 /ORGANISM="Peridinium aciculiferum, Strain PAER-2" /LENGTH=65 /DNA_ID=CAMNT_0025567939 /DNA_START=54 /DNA_END=251 /DNA_ORIENTATION=+